MTHSPKINLQIKRIYDPSAHSDGYRVLVDRLWPRGISKETAHVDHWLKEIAPSHDLRTWFNHEPSKWAVFQEKYRQELESQTHTLTQLLKDCPHPTLTLLFAAKDCDHNNAVVLKERLTEILRSSAH